VIAPAAEPPEPIDTAAEDRTGDPVTSGSRARPRGITATLPFEALVRAMRPAQWLKNGILFAGLVFGDKLFEPSAVARAVFAVVCFSLLSRGFYLVNDVRDMKADQQHPSKRFRPIAAGEIAPAQGLLCGMLFIVLALAGSALLGERFLLIALAYSLLMAAYNLWLKSIVVVDVVVIATGFVLRAAAGAVAVDVTISPWLLICTMLLALLISFGKRRHELSTLAMAGLHRPSLDAYSRAMLDACVILAAVGTLIAYSVYTVDAESVPHDRRMLSTVPIVIFGVARYLYLLYRRGEGGAPETMLIADRGLLIAVGLWGLASALLLYLPG
jgi:4-hydroxybenzoate polyprenyltransferase